MIWLTLWHGRLTTCWPFLLVKIHEKWNFCHNQSTSQFICLILIIIQYSENCERRCATAQGGTVNVLSRHLMGELLPICPAFQYVTCSGLMYCSVPFLVVRRTLADMRPSLTSVVFSLMNVATPKSVTLTSPLLSSNKMFCGWKQKITSVTELVHKPWTRSSVRYS